MEHQVKQSLEEPTLGRWLRALRRGPIEPYGSYFDDLRVQVASSAPVCTATSASAACRS